MDVVSVTFNVGFWKVVVKLRGRLPAIAIPRPLKKRLRHAPWPHGIVGVWHMYNVTGATIMRRYWLNFSECRPNFRMCCNLYPYDMKHYGAVTRPWLLRFLSSWLLANPKMGKEVECWWSWGGWMKPPVSARLSLSTPLNMRYFRPFKLMSYIKINSHTLIMKGEVSHRDVAVNMFFFLLPF